ncbi:MAG: glycosyltransferase family 2 protein [Betaproteobacteria bacterium]|nr:glycosyltransferase family 2 protein [Betaproteobacteria bacterium]
MSTGKPSRTPSPRWLGEVEGLDRGQVYGWCFDTQDPGARVVLELCLAGESVGSFTADVARSDLLPLLKKHTPAATWLDNCHGFVADMGAHYEHREGVITVRVANTAFVLSGAIEANKVKAPPAAALSLVFSDGGLRLLGWAKNQTSTTKPVAIRAFVGESMVAQALANVEHPSLNTFQVGRCGFMLDLPLTLADGQVHAVRVVDDQGAPLNGSPVAVCCYANGVGTLLPSQQGVLPTLIQEFERYIPRSLGLQHYGQWAAEFESAPPSSGSTTSSSSVAIIITGEPDAALIARTTESLHKQAGVKLRIFSPLAGKSKTVQSFGQLLHQAIQSASVAMACVRAGDTLAEHALAHALRAFGTDHVQLAYTDSEYLGQPWFKPAWNLDYAVATDYPLELMLVASSLASQCLDLKSLPNDAAQFAWQVLAAANQAKGIAHVPRVLYHFHTPLSDTERKARFTAASQMLERQAPEANITALDGVPASTLFEPRRLSRNLSGKALKTVVTLIIPTRDRVELLKRCIVSMQKRTPWPHLEIMVVDNDSVLPETKEYFTQLRKQGVTVLPAPGEFNFARLNNLAVKAARGQVVGLINNDVETLHTGWLEEILSHLLSPGVGAVGAKLLWPNGMVQHGGVLLGVGNAAGHYGNLLADADFGNHGRNQLVQQVSAVTAACLFMRRADYLELGGMDEAAFPVAFNDVDLCLRIRAQGKTIVWTPHAKLLHAESASRGNEDTPQKRARSQRERANLRERWGHVLLQDPAYHPSLNLDPHGHAFGGLAIPPRDRAPRLPGLFATTP